MNQMLTLSEEGIRKELGYGKLGHEEEERIISEELIPRFKKEKYR